MSSNDNARPRATIAYIESEFPSCPHCNAVEICAAKIDLEALLEAWPIASFRAAGPDGYAMRVNHNDLVVDCPACLKPSVVLIANGHITLLAARTELDERYAERKT